MGPLSPSHIFRPAVVELLVTLEELLVSAPMYVAQVLARPRPPEAQVQTIWAKTVQEATEGARDMEGPYTKSQIDELHGVGGWRLLFVLPHKNEAASTESLTTGEQVHKTMRRGQKNVFTHAIRPQVQQSPAVSVVFWVPPLRVTWLCEVPLKIRIQHLGSCPSTLKV